MLSRCTYRSTAGGYDAFVRVWNPYVNSKPIVFLTGHQAPIISVAIDQSLEVVISFAENKELRVHDLNRQLCIQTFYKQMLPEMGPRHISSCMYNPIRKVCVCDVTFVVAPVDVEKRCASV